MFLLSIPLFALLFNLTYSQKNEPFLMSYIMIKVGETAEISLPLFGNYRRRVLRPSGEEEHLYRVCNGKNKEKCGFWEDVKTKKKVASGTTTYNKKKKALIIKKIRFSDDGTYMTGNKAKSTLVRVQLS